MEYENKNQFTPTCMSKGKRIGCDGKNLDPKQAKRKSKKIGSENKISPA
jgi:hypothetical protein